MYVYICIYVYMVPVYGLGSTTSRQSYRATMRRQFTFYH